MTQRSKLPHDLVSPRDNLDAAEPPRGIAAQEIAGRYLRRGTLGTGSGTVVHEAFDQLLERRVAIKVVALPPAEDPETAEAIARFRRAARAAGGLRHANIVAVLDYGETAEEAWIVMELVEGGSLQRLLDGGGPLPPDRAAGIMVQLLEGLGYAHARGIAHRDLRAANILLTPAGTVKLADFGIARPAGLALAPVSPVASPMASPKAASPGPARGGTPEQRADIRAAGAVLYQMLTGERPLGGIAAFLPKAQQAGPVPPSRLRPQAGLEGFDPVVARAMARAPADRFPTAADFCAAVQAA
ncbi:serine/threonine-protein kinase, partial [Paeniroseomonas aquatica]